MEKSNINSFLEINSNGKEIFRGLKMPVFSIRSTRGMGQNIYSFYRPNKVEVQTGLNSIVYVGHTILKIIATVAISVLILLGVIGFFALVMISNNVILEVIIPLTFYQAICVFSLYYMWTPMKGWGTN